MRDKIIILKETRALSIRINNFALGTPVCLKSRDLVAYNFKVNT